MCISTVASVLVCVACFIIMTKDGSQIPHEVFLLLWLWTEGFCEVWLWKLLSHAAMMVAKQAFNKAFHPDPIVLFGSSSWRNKTSLPRSAVNAAASQFPCPQGRRCVGIINLKILKYQLKRNKSLKRGWARRWKCVWSRKWRKQKSQSFSGIFNPLLLFLQWGTGQMERLISAKVQLNVLLGFVLVFQPCKSQNKTRKLSFPLTLSSQQGTNPFLGRPGFFLFPRGFLS